MKPKKYLDGLEAAWQSTDGPKRLEKKLAIIAERLAPRGKIVDDPAVVIGQKQADLLNLDKPT